MSAATVIRRATADEHGALVDVLVDAFARDPLARWLYPDPVERDRQHRALFAAILSTAGPGQTVDTDDDLSAVAIWRRVDARPDPAAPGGAGPDVDRLFGAISRAAPTPPYLNLAFIGARIGGTGAGSALMRHGLAGVTGPVALWTGNANNLAFYERAGFAVSEHVAFGGAEAWWLVAEAAS